MRYAGFVKGEASSSAPSTKPMKNLTTAKATALRIARADWSPAIRTTAYAIAAAATAAYVAGLVTGRWVHRLNDQLALWASSRHRQPAASSEALAPVIASPVAPVAAPEPIHVIIQRQSPAPAPIARPAHIADPMARAVKMVKAGKSQRLAAGTCGVSRSSLQRALKTA